MGSLENGPMSHRLLLKNRRVFWSHPPTRALPISYEVLCRLSRRAASSSPCLRPHLHSQAQIVILTHSEYYCSFRSRSGSGRFVRSGAFETEKYVTFTLFDYQGLVELLLCANGILTRRRDDRPHVLKE